MRDTSSFFFSTFPSLPRFSSLINESGENLCFRGYEEYGEKCSCDKKKKEEKKKIGTSRHWQEESSFSSQPVSIAAGVFSSGRLREDGCKRFTVALFSRYLQCAEGERAFITTAPYVTDNRGSLAGSKAIVSTVPGHSGILKVSAPVVDPFNDMQEWM